jgi:hypothetical protein
MPAEEKITATISRLEAMLDGTWAPEPRENSHPNKVDLYGGISGVAQGEAAIEVPHRGNGRDRDCS